MNFFKKKSVVLKTAKAVACVVVLVTAPSIGILLVLINCFYLLYLGKWKESSLELAAFLLIWMSLFHYSCYKLDFDVLAVSSGWYDETGKKLLLDIHLLKLPNLTFQTYFIFSKLSEWLGCDINLSHIHPFFLLRYLLRRADCQGGGGDESTDGQSAAEEYEKDHKTCKDLIKRATEGKTTLTGNPIFRANVGLSDDGERLVGGANVWVPFVGNYSFCAGRPATEEDKKTYGSDNKR